MDINKDQSIIQTISLVQEEISKLGIGKNNTNELQKYKYRGIDDLYNTISSIYAKYGLVILHETLEYNRELGTTQKGGPQITVTQKIKYTFYHVHNDKNISCIQWGEAIDSSDKATNKSYSQGYKYMAIQAFAIPLVGNEDGDAYTPELPVTKDMKNIIKVMDHKEISMENIKILFKLKKENIAQEYQDKLQNIIDGKETGDILKIHNYLKNL